MARMTAVDVGAFIATMATPSRPVPTERAGWRICRDLAIAVVLIGSMAAARADTASHGPAYWRSLKQQDFKVPAETGVLPLAIEATALLGSTDPELRDEIAYEAFVAWVYRDQRLTPAELNQLRVILVRHAVYGLGDSEDDSLFLRSFSILVLSVLAAQDLKVPFLDATAFNELVDLGVYSLTDERDLRGYVPHKGWGHATAHCADLLKFLARSQRLSREQQARMVEAIAHRLQTAGQVFTWGEDARLAYALAALAHRADADPSPFSAWFSAVQQQHARVWSGKFDPSLYVRERAQLNALSELAADLEAETTGAGTQDIRTGLRALRAATR
jgi:hypothetical protein